jgi:hypothetical protein
MMHWRRSGARVAALISGSLRRLRRLDEFERRLQDLAIGHQQLARSAEEHLAALQASAERLVIAQRGFEEEIAALRRSLAAVEACLADVERSQGWVSAALTRHGLTKIPE